jgi:membrane protease YdiL (CAAX protease family)
MEKEKRFNFKNILTGVGVIFFYLFTSTFVTEILSGLGINYDKLSTPLKSTCLIIYQILMTLVIVYIYKKTIITDFKVFIKNNIKYFKEYIKYWFLMLILMISSNLIVTFFTTTDIANNQETIIETLKVAPIYTFIITVFVAPILEELVFRLSFRKIFSNNILFVLLSGLVFGSLHVIGTCEHLIDLLFIIPYSIPGFIFAYVYTKSKNIYMPISLHFIHNGIMMSLQILLLILT